MRHGKLSTPRVVYPIILCTMWLASISAARPIASDDLLYDMAVEPNVADSLQPVTSGDRAGCSAYKLDGFKFYRGTDLPGKSILCAPLGRMTAYDIASQCTHTRDCVSFHLYQAAGKHPSFCLNSARGPMKPAYDSIAKGKCQGVYVLKGWGVMSSYGAIAQMQAESKGREHAWHVKPQRGGAIKAMVTGTAGRERNDG